MKFTASHYARLLYEITKDASKSEAPKRVQQFIDLLVKHKNIKLLPAIERLYVRMSETHGAYQRILITTARSHTLLASRFKEFDQVDLHIDPSLLGGMRVQIGDDVWDASLKKQLLRLREVIHTYR